MHYQLKVRGMDGSLASGLRCPWPAHLRTGVHVAQQGVDMLTRHHAKAVKDFMTLGRGQPVSMP